VDDFAAAIEAPLPNVDLQAYALGRFSLEAVGPLYARYFGRLGEPQPVPVCPRIRARAFDIQGVRRISTIMPAPTATMMTARPRAATTWPAMK
jgi:hypothetical protein